MKTVIHRINCLLITVLPFAISCSNEQSRGRPGTDGVVKEYEVMEVAVQSITLQKDYPAILKGQQTVEIRPKISGYIEQILIDEGAAVRKGQMLFRLNDTDLQAIVRSAEAQVKVAEADVVTARVNLKKTGPLVDKNIISKFDLESTESTLKAKEAQLALAKANLENAKANLQYTLITSPTEGIIGTFPYRIGSLVNSNISEPLATVSNTFRMYAYFSLNEKDFLDLMNGLAGRTVQEKLEKMPEVHLLLADNTPYIHQGRIETASGLVDQKTGAVTLRATFPNPEGLLRNGGSGVIRIPERIESAITVPQSATYELQGKRFLYVVAPGDTVRNTEIEVIAGNLKDSFVVTSGLQVGDTIVKEGIISLRNNLVIKPKLVESDSLPGNGAAAVPVPATANTQ